jgi:hypothetical protein
MANVMLVSEVVGMVQESMDIEMFRATDVYLAYKTQNQ